MALGGGGGSAAEQTTLPADVALAWASLERARAVQLRRLERGAERQERSRVARTPRAGRLLPPAEQKDSLGSGEGAELSRAQESFPRCPGQVQKGATGVGGHLGGVCDCTLHLPLLALPLLNPGGQHWGHQLALRVLRMPYAGLLCLPFRLEGDFPERGAGGGLSSRTVGCPPPAGSSSGARRTRLPDAQQDPRPAGAAVGLSSRSSPSPEGALPASSGKGRLAAPGPAGSLRKGASPHRAAQPPAPPRPVPGEGLRAWRLAGLKEDSPEDRKLQRLKAKIREQQQRRQPRSRHVPGGGRPAPGSFGEGPQAWLHPLKRTVRTLALAAAGGTTEGPGVKGVPFLESPTSQCSSQDVGSGGERQSAPVGWGLTLQNRDPSQSEKEFPAS
ncbi:hypothetical protein lerEdw1_009344 [Lerista edwardsae]|nr:hypothetical protein lerEdw1_009344 [Lerista edwardsae]